MWSKENFSLVAAVLSIGYATYCAFIFKLAVDVSVLEFMNEQLRVPLTSLGIVFCICALCGRELKSIFQGYIIGSMGGILYFFSSQNDLERTRQTTFAQDVLDHYGLTDFMVFILICASSVFVVMMAGIGLDFLIRLAERGRSPKRLR